MAFLALLGACGMVQVPAPSDGDEPRIEDVDGSGNAHGDEDERPDAPAPGTDPAHEPAPEPEPDPTDAGILGELAQLVNEARSEGRSCGSYGWFDPAPPLSIDGTLTNVAEAHSVDQAEMARMSHTGSDGSTLRERIDRSGYAWMAIGENVAYNYRSTEHVMAGWLSSDGHCRNIMNATFEELGLGLEDWYWTQVFATPY